MSKQAGVNRELWKAVERSNEDAVRLLLKGGGDPNYKSFHISYNTTLLMVASDKGCQSIVQLLLKSGARVNESNSGGWTALHYAAWKGHHGIVLDLIKMQAEVNALTRKGETPLYWTARYGYDQVVRVLMGHKANPNVQRRICGNTPLHEAARRQYAGIVHILIENEADPDIKNRDHAYPHQMTTGSLRQQMLRYWEEYRVAQLLKLGKISLKIVKGYVVGSSRAGKTTFARAVTGLGDASNVSERTPGIDIMEFTLENVGCMKVHDLAGHDLFHTTHSFFFGGVSALFIYVVDTDWSRDEMLADAIYWLAFIISGRLPGGPPVHILILGSRGGGEDQEARQFMLNSVTREIVKKFESRFIFLLGDQSLVVDMRQAGSKEMEEVKECLAIGAQKCLERVTDVPLVCHKVQAITLPQLRDEKAAQSSSGISSGQFTDKSEFHRSVLKVSDALTDASLYASLLHYLEEWGEIVDAGSHIVIDTLWLCRSLLAAVLASKADPRSFEFRIRMKAEDDGTATLDDITRVLDDFRLLNETPAVDPKAGINILCHMGLAFPTEKQDVYRFPALIQDSKPERAWVKAQYTSVEPHSMVYVGIRLQCQSDIEIITPAVMPLLQGQVAKQQNEMAVIMWNGGMLVQRICEPAQPKIEGLVLISDKKRAIRALDLVTRGPAHCQGDAKQFLDKLQHIALEIIDKMSPGTRVEKCYLSHQQIIQHIDKPFCYSQEEVDLAKKEKGVLTKKTGDQIITDSVIDLLAVDDDHIIYKLQSLSKYKSHWLELGCILLSYTEEEVIELSSVLGHGSKMADKLYLVVETWIRRQWRTATLDTFLKACDTVDRQSGQQKAKRARLMTQDISSSANTKVVDTEELKSVAGKVGVDEVIKAVVKHGSDKWYQIGLALGLTNATVTSTTHTIPSCPGKLHAIIEMRRQHVGNDRVRNALVNICFDLDTPIAVAVRDELIMCM